MEDPMVTFENELADLVDSFLHGSLVKPTELAAHLMLAKAELVRRRERIEEQQVFMGIARADEEEVTLAVATKPKHRHVFDAGGVCRVETPTGPEGTDTRECGKVKAPNGRKPAAPATGAASDAPAAK